MKRNKSTRRCRPSYRISEAGHLLSTNHSRRAGSVLSHEGKKEKMKRLKRGCLYGTEDTFQLTAKQKRNLPEALQKSIIGYHRRLGKRIID